MPSSVRDYGTRAYTVGVSGSTDSGKTLLLLALCRLLRDNYSIAVVTRHPIPDQDGTRDFLLRHKALAPTRIVAVAGEGYTDLAIEWLMTEFRPELIFVEDATDDGQIDLPDFTVHVVNGLAEKLSPDDVIAATRSDLLVLNKTLVGPPLDVERNISVREAMRVRGDAPCVFAQARYGIGTIEIARQFLASWRQTDAPTVWALPVEGKAMLVPA